MQGIPDGVCASAGRPGVCGGRATVQGPRGPCFSLHGPCSPSLHTPPCTLHSAPCVYNKDTCFPQRQQDPEAWVRKTLRSDEQGFGQLLALLGNSVEE